MPNPGVGYFENRPQNVSIPNTLDLEIVLQRAHEAIVAVQSFHDEVRAFFATPRSDGIVEIDTMKFSNFLFPESRDPAQ